EHHWAAGVFDVDKEPAGQVIEVERIRRGAVLIHRLANAVRIVDALVERVDGRRRSAPYLLRTEPDCDQSGRRPGRPWRLAQHLDATMPNCSGCARATRNGDRQYSDECQRP